MKKIFKIIIGLSVLATFGGFITRQLGISYENSQIIKNIVFFLAFYFIVRNVKDIQINSKRTKSISKLASSSSWNILNPTGFLIKMTLKNPKLLEQLISPESKNKKQILTEIKKITKVKEIKKVDDENTDILVTFIDQSEHWYRAHTKLHKIISLSRYS